MLAEQKLRELKSEPLAFSPGTSLEENLEGYVEYLDKKGVVLGSGAVPQPRTAFIRRWSVSRVPENPEIQGLIRVLILFNGSREPMRPVHVMMVRSRETD